MSAIGNGVTLRGITQDPFYYTFALAAGITIADLGKAVALDSSAANTVKLAADGQRVIGRLETFENRVQEGITVGTVSLMDGTDYPVKAADALAVGDTAVGGGAGSIRKALTADGISNLFVVEMLTGGRAVAIKA